MSPTQRSLALARSNGYTATVVEHWNPFARRRVDLYGIIDVLAVKEGETLAIQTTSYSNVSARVKKIAEHENTPILRKAGWRIEVHGWHKVKNRYQVRVVDVS